MNSPIADRSNRLSLQIKIRVPGVTVHQLSLEVVEAGNGWIAPGIDDAICVNKNVVCIAYDGVIEDVP